MANPTPPLVGGWGGLLTNGANRFNASNPPSTVFPGEQASDTEVVFALTKQRGMNAMRVSVVDPGFATTGDVPPWLSTFDSNGYDRTIAIAKAMDMWILNDYHAYTDQIDAESAWINFWLTNVIPKAAVWDKMIWEPINEPIDSSASTLAVHYQNWINAVRATGDTHWIAVSINNYQDEYAPNFTQFFPIVNDPVDSVFYTFHDYYFYYLASGNQYDGLQGWNTANAQSFADKMNDNVTVVQSLGRPVLMTEFGADPQGGSSQPVPPDIVIGGSAGYAPESLAYAQRLVNNLDNRSPRVGYFLWTGGDWTDTPGAGPTGALNIWGQQVTFKNFNNIVTTPDFTWLIAAGAAGLAGLGLYAVLRRGGKKGGKK
jgi:hypothetical protein